jgi:hypothetical protein
VRKVGAEKHKIAFVELLKPLAYNGGCPAFLEVDKFYIRMIMPAGMQTARFRFENKRAVCLRMDQSAPNLRVTCFMESSCEVRR